MCSVDLLSRVNRSNPARSGDFDLADDAGVPPYAHGRIGPDPIEGLVGYYVDGKSSKYFKGPRPVKAIDHLLGNGLVGFLERDDFSSNRHPFFTSDSRPSSQRSAGPNANTGSGPELFIASSVTMSGR